MALRAGRGFRAGESNRVEFLPDKGQIEVDVQDGLARFCTITYTPALLSTLTTTTTGWRSRATDSLEDELMLFPQDSKFERVSEEPTGRAFKLSFESSKAIHFVGDESSQ